MATDNGQSVICVPMKLDAFVMNKTVCNPPPGSTVAPITQPNYTFLRLGHSTTSQEFLIQPDLMDHVDLHAAGDVNTNPRLTNLGTGELIDRRVGVYLSWIIPRFYRQGAANAQDTTQPGVADAEQTRRKQEGTFNTNYGGGTATNPADLTAPTFRSTPNRWLVIRRLHMDTVKQPSVVQDGLLQEFQGWILESDRLVDFDNLGPTDDIEVDMAPFVQGSSDDLNSQAEIFIGVQFDAVGWTEAGNAPGITRIPVSVLNSSNQLFADFTMHNSNVYSILGRFEGKDKVRHVTDATASYYVLGWHSTDTLADDVFNIQISNATDPSNPTRGTRFDGCNMVFPDDTFASQKDLSTWRGLSTSASTLCHRGHSSHSIPDTKAPIRKNTPGRADIKNDMKPLELPVVVASSGPYSHSLDLHEFRLICLSGTADGNYPVHVGLETYQHDNCPEYEAVSYTWGGEANDYTLCRPVYAGPYWDVLLQTRNCWSMLHYLRPRRGIRLIWVDAISINQNRTTMKSANSKWQK